MRDEIFGTPFLGIYSIATESAVYLPSGFDKGHGGARFSDILSAPAKFISIYGSPLIGMFGKANSNGLLIPSISEVPTGVENVTEVTDKFTALGNLILTNDSGALISPEFSKRAESEIKTGLGVAEVVRGTIGGSGLVGGLGFATNSGALISPRANEAELELIKSVLKIQNCGIGSLNRGSDFVGVCAIGNSKGGLVGNITTPIEITRLEDVFNG
ncbi:MAG: translation initiation factor IF-6 [archaeon]